MKLDDVSWHLRTHEEDLGRAERAALGDEDAVLARVEMLAATHIGMFLAWCVERDLASDELRRELSGEVAAVRERRLTGAELLLQHMDGKLGVRDLNEEGGRFAAAAYEGYLGGWNDLMGDVWAEEGHVENTWSNYDRVRTWLDARYDGWRSAPG